MDEYTKSLVISSRLTRKYNKEIHTVTVNEHFKVEDKDLCWWIKHGRVEKATFDPIPTRVWITLFSKTLAKIEDIKSITPMNIVRANDPREINFFTFPFVIQMKKSTELKFADDAIDGKWVLLSRSTNNLAFTHHKEILKQVDF